METTRAEKWSQHISSKHFSSLSGHLSLAARGNSRIWFPVYMEHYYGLFMADFWETGKGCLWNSQILHKDTGHVIVPSGMCARLKMSSFIQGKKKHFKSMIQKKQLWTTLLLGICVHLNFLWILSRLKVWDEPALNYRQMKVYPIFIFRPCLS